jgi:hypothetical protein
MDKSEKAIHKVSRSKLVSLVIECQMGGNPDDCPLYAKRSLSFAERVEWIKSLPDADIHDIYAAHRACLESKVKA